MASSVAGVGLAPASVGATTTSGGSDSGGSDSADTTGTSTGDTATTGGASSDEGDSSDDLCGTCTEPPMPVQILSPANGASVASPFEVTVDATYSCSCDTCGCYEDQPYYVEIRAGDMTVASCTAGNCSGTQNLEVDLPPGEYDLVALAEYSFHFESSNMVHVTVTAGASGGSNQTSGGVDTTDTDGTDSGSLEGRDQGCACNAAPRPLSTGLAGLALLALVARRRRD